MKRQNVNYIVDLLMAISFIMSAFTGLVIFFFLPLKVRHGGYQEFMGIIKGTWASVHTWLGIFMILTVLIHLILHWNWMARMTKSVFIGKKAKK